MPSPPALVSRTPPPSVSGMDVSSSLHEQPGVNASPAASIVIKQRRMGPLFVCTGAK